MSYFVMKKDTIITFDASPVGKRLQMMAAVLLLMLAEYYLQSRNDIRSLKRKL